MRTSRTSIDVGGVLHTGRDVELLEDLELPDFAAFRFPNPVAMVLTLRRVGGGLEARGSVTGAATGECARCLDPVPVLIEVRIDERFDPRAGADDPFGESNVLRGDVLDALDLVRQSIDSALPMTVLCSEDCRGLCSTCGQKQDGGCGHAQPE